MKKGSNNDAERARRINAKIDEAKESVSRMTPEAFNEFIVYLFNGPLIPYAGALSKTAQAAKDEGAISELVRGLFKDAESLARYRYGAKSNVINVVRLAEEVRRCRKIDPNNATSSDLENLSAYLQRVKAATDKGDADFFRTLADAVALAHDSYAPPASREALHFALIIVQRYRMAGLTPTKSDVREEVERMRAEMGRPRGRDGEGAKILWQRDVWKHPDLAGLKERKRGQVPVPLPD